jgi:hypothetical protein
LVITQICPTSSFLPSFQTVSEGVYYGEPKADYDLQALCEFLGIANKAQARKDLYRTQRENRVNWEIWRARQEWARKYGMAAPSMLDHAFPCHADNTR